MQCPFLNKVDKSVDSDLGETKKNIKFADENTNGISDEKHKE